MKEKEEKNRDGYTKDDRWALLHTAKIMLEEWGFDKKKRHYLLLTDELENEDFDIISNAEFADDLASLILLCFWQRKDVFELVMFLILNGRDFKKELSEFGKEAGDVSPK